MKFLKVIGIIILVLVIAFFVLAFIGPKGFEVKRTRVIKAPKELVWNQISDFKAWEAWSPWQEKDPSTENTYEGTVNEKGYKMSWVGDISGTGSMTLVQANPEDSIWYDLAFEKPYESKATNGFKLNETEEGTEVTWWITGEYGLIERPMMMFMDMEKMIGGDFERGLERLDSVSVVEAKRIEEENKVDIQEVTFNEVTYVGIRHKTSMKEAMTSEFFATNYGKLSEYFEEEELEMVREKGPSALTYSWNEQDSTTEIVLAFPVKKVKKVDDGFEIIEVSTKSALLVDLYGDYSSPEYAEGAMKSHMALSMYIQENGLTQGLVIEEYPTDPATTAPENMLTKIYYLLESPETAVKEMEDE